MVKDPDRLIALSYAASDVRPKLELAFALDTALADVLRAVREPMIARIRIAWWREQLEALAHGQAAAPEPLLTAIGKVFEAETVNALCALPDAWDMLTDTAPEIGAILEFSRLRGAGLNTVSPDAALTKVMSFWSLADFAAHCSDPALAEQARAEARRCAPASLKGIPRSFRVMAGLARDDLMRPEKRQPGSPSRLLRAFRHAMLSS